MTIKISEADLRGVFDHKCEQPDCPVCTERIHCMNCGKSVSTPVPKETVVRAWVECPECIEKKAQ